MAKEIVKNNVKYLVLIGQMAEKIKEIVKIEAKKQKKF